MKYYTISPPPVLAPYVRFFWVFEGDRISASGEPYVYRSMADGCAELIFHYQGGFDELTDTGRIKSDLSGLAGQSQRFRRYIIQEDFGIFGVYLYPFAIPMFFSLPANELSNQMFNLRSLIGKLEDGLEEKIMLAKTNQERCSLLSAFLEKRLQHNQMQIDRLHHSILHIIHMRGNIDVMQLADNYCLSMRQFQRKFKMLSGFSPKLYTRIIRFGAAMNEYGNQFRSLTDIAYECGYYDQSHFIHDFKEFSGYHPKQYFSGRAEGIEWRED